ncbi:SDR family NAD(P)-dependent oxidoreductase [Halosimplex salinum]|uniref:SDR family NAD(P)-dependent oxidoreductase n=1 Tax=Halosimplex salinum TaxID=1710538 RepID=UPI000F46E36E|nr:SDR family oxidoreductase [Halosimplex salinum]
MGTITADFSDETVIVTGASSGIGRAVAVGFGEAGATVINADVRADPKDQNAEAAAGDAETPTHELIDDETEGRGVFVETDVSEYDDLAAVVEGAREFDGVGVMVNNAGIHVSREFLDVTPAEYDRLHAVNARGAFFGTQLAARDMIDRGEGGVVVNTASTTSGHAEWEHSHYATTKGAVKMLTQSAALELAEHGVRVNAVAPGPIATEITEGWSQRAEDSVGGGRRPPTRAGRPEDLKDAYRYLASEGADYVTGETLWVDGGSHI